MLAAIALTFMAVFLLTITLWFIISAAKQSPLKQRLKRMQEDKQDNKSTETVRNIVRKDTLAEQAIHRLPLQGPIGRLLEHSGTSMSLTFFTGLTGALAAVVFTLLLFLKINPALDLGAAALAAVIPAIYLHHLRTKHRKKFDEQIPDILLMISRSLQAGHSLVGAVELVGQMMPEPAGRLFRIAFEQQKLGMRVTEALASLPDQVDSIDLNFFVTIVKMNNEIGGSLAETLERLAETVRSRHQIRRQILVHTAEGRLSGYVLSALPFVIFGIIYIANPTYMDPFFTNEACRMLLVAVVVAQVIGFIVIRSIVNIRI